ncbi:DNA topoisomerase I [Glutamicibacter uratoxydans]|uniref:DNA topoisomerase n=1 Tax=Glutamicibacter uratoxydans TaxID=43667 RepID=A0A4Y4DL04_GLUUR|nr:DNA topoisomerase IB [Glutamicibacter uratoxydans]GED05989.1 DNA topoisomerase I [Glutamicibacter uratoxydans]
MAHRSRSNRKLPIRRRRRGSGFRYLDSQQTVEDPATLQRIKELSIPPAWREVEISRSPRAKVQARGVDAAGRTQTIYHPAFRARREREKFDKLVEFGRALPQLRKQVQRDLRRRHDDREWVTACLVLLLDEHLLRVGSPAYARKHQSFGASTLRRKHVRTEGEHVVLAFGGKSGQQHRIKVVDKQVARVLLELCRRPGYELFSYLDADSHSRLLQPQQVNAYLSHHMGEGFTAKDFRTWGGTLAGFTALLDAPAKTEAGALKQLLLEAASQQLGNTAAIAQSSYVDPRVIELAGEADRLAILRHSRAHFKTRPHMDANHQALVSFLRKTPADQN